MNFLSLCKKHFSHVSSVICGLQIAKPQQQQLQRIEQRGRRSEDKTQLSFLCTTPPPPFSAPTNSTNHTPTASFAQVGSPKNEHEHCRIKSNMKPSTLWVPSVTLDHTRQDILYHHLLPRVCSAAFFHVEVGPDAAVQHHSAKALHLKGAQQYGGH